MSAAGFALTETDIRFANRAACAIGYDLEYGEILRERGRVDVTLTISYRQTNELITIRQTLASAVIPADFYSFIGFTGLSVSVVSGRIMCRACNFAVLCFTGTRIY